MFSTFPIPIPYLPIPIVDRGRIDDLHNLHLVALTRDLLLLLMVVEDHLVLLLRVLKPPIVPLLPVLVLPPQVGVQLLLGAWGQGSWVQLLGPRQGSTCEVAGFSVLAVGGHVSDRRRLAGCVGGWLALY